MGYNVLLRNQPNRRGGGCLAYIKKSLHPSELNHPVLDHVSDSIWFSVPLNNQELVVGCIYRQPGQNISDIPHIIDAFNYIAALPPSPKIIAGDFNLPHICWSSHSAPHRLWDFMSCIRIGLWTQHVTNPTRGCNILDLVFSTGISDMGTSVDDHTTGSDHKIVNFHFSAARLESTCSAPKKPFHQIDWNSVQAVLRTLSWDVFFLTQNPQLAADILYSNFFRCIDLLLPTLPNAKQRNNGKHSKAILLLKNLKRSYELSRDFSLLLRIDRLSKELQRSDERRLLKQETSALIHANRAGQLAFLMKARTKNARTTIPFISVSNSHYINSPIAISEAFNTYFATSLIIETNISATTPPLLSHEQLSTIDFQLNTIRKTLTTVKPSFKPGPDGIPPAMLSLGGSDIALLLLNLFNLSMKFAVVPSQWKTSIIIPTHKKGPLHDPANYRPINHTPVISRAMERIIKDQMSQFLLSQNLIDSRQHGFLKSRSCVTCQFDFLNLITSTADTGKAFIVIFLDMTKAFDRVPHSRLLNKLRSYGILDPLHSWLSSYLSMRSQVVCIDDTLSQPKPVTSGVIQGSVLGPLLFLIYINDVFTTFKHGCPFLFADDIKIVYTFDPDSLNPAISAINEDLRNLEAWCSSWLMKFSVPKCMVLTFKCCLQPGTFTLNDAPITCSPVVRDLGLQYSCTFNFSEHTPLQIAKAKRTINMILRSFHLRPCRLCLYKSHARPLLEYCPIIFSLVRKADRVAIENVQRLFTKQVVGFSTPLTYRLRCELLALEPLWFRRVKLNLGFLHKLVHGLVHSASQPLEVSSHSPYFLRHGDFKIRLPIAKSALRYNFFLPVYSKLWNWLPPSVRSCASPIQFKSALASFLSVEQLIEFYNPYTSLDRAFEDGLSV
ncbi:RNA-directed DNA polymerase [Streptococcus dysgalactiae subsp. equisimilis]|nr:reverse transcriptase family protein [Streptococcus dysgalactiae]MBM6549288.1 RNA-directed DNA polymerase [Streptococcus dysgalactiae subsp. equisimilis]